jgi:alpha-N-acetylglucosaminidase
MGNIQSWSGPLTENWHKYQSSLQTEILKRMRDFGMLPILPAFSGHVPKSITKVFPDAKVTKLSDWGRFGTNSWLAPIQLIILKNIFI